MCMYLSKVWLGCYLWKKYLIKIFYNCGFYLEEIDIIELNMGSSYMNMLIFILILN